MMDAAVVVALADPFCADEAEASQECWNEECGRLLDQLRAHHRAGGPPIHIDILTDDDEPGIVWPQIYVMSPVFEGGCVVGWWCTGCGYEKAADDE